MNRVGCDWNGKNAQVPENCLGNESLGHYTTHHLCHCQSKRVIGLKDEKKG